MKELTDIYFKEEINFDDFEESEYPAETGQDESDQHSATKDEFSEFQATKRERDQDRDQSELLAEIVAGQGSERKKTDSLNLLASQRDLIIDLSSQKLNVENALKSLKSDHRKTVKSLKRSIMQTEENLTKEYQMRTETLLTEIERLVSENHKIVLSADTIEI